MKRCPTCQRAYPDDKQLFCLEDGATLVTVAVNDPLSPHTRPLREGRDTAPPATEVMTAAINNPLPPATPKSGPPPVAAGPSKRAGLFLGVMALLFALLSFALMVAGFASVVSETYSDFGAALIIITMFLSLLGTALGLGGIIRAVRNGNSRLWPILGFVANVLYLLFILGLLLLGLAAGK